MTRPLVSLHRCSTLLFDSNVDDACSSDASAREGEGRVAVVFGLAAYLGLTAYAAWFLFRLAAGI